MPNLNRKEDGKSLRREKEMYVRLRTEWNSYWKDSILELSDEDARDLIRKRIAISARKDDCMREIGRGPRDKALWGPQKDKMISQSPKDKKRNHRSEAPTGAHGKREMI